MAGPCIRRNTVGAPSNGNGISIPTPTISCTLTPIPTQTPVPIKAPVPTQASAPILALASALGSLGRYTDKDLQRTIKLALELFVKGQKHG